MNKALTSIDVMLTNPFAVRGEIPESVQDVIRAEMESRVPPQFRPKKMEGPSYAADRAHWRSIHAPRVSQLLSEGASVKKIAEEIGASRDTVVRIIREHGMIKVDMRRRENKLRK